MKKIDEEFYTQAIFMLACIESFCKELVQSLEEAEHESFSIAMKRTMHSFTVASKNIASFKDEYDENEDKDRVLATLRVVKKYFDNYNSSINASCPSKFITDIKFLVDSINTMALTVRVKLKDVKKKHGFANDLPY